MDNQYLDEDDFQDEENAASQEEKAAAFKAGAEFESHLTSFEIKEVIAGLFKGFNEQTATLLKHMKNSDENFKRVRNANPEADKRFNNLISSYIRYDEDEIGLGIPRSVQISK